MRLEPRPRSDIVAPGTGPWARARSVVSVLISVSVVACGSKPPPVVKPPEPEPPKAEPHAPRMQMASELGSIDADQTAKTFKGLQDTFLGCHKKGLTRVPYLEGSLKFFMRVGPDGIVRWTYLEESTLGDFVTETCLLDAVRSTKWPTPEGGEAEVRGGTAFEAPGGRVAAPWSAEKLAPVIAKESAAIAKCKKDAKNTRFRVTLYVKPQRKRGKVQAVGVAVAAKGGDAAAECLVHEIESWKVPSPGKVPVKVSFDL